jgi:nucleotide-binding universal stress UspA family protein
MPAQGARIEVADSSALDVSALTEPKGDILYKKVLLAYDGSIEGRRALREGARVAQLCGADVHLLAVADVSAATAAVEVGFVMPMTEQVEIYETILEEGVERLKAMGFTPTASLSIGEAGREIAKVAKTMKANLVVVGHRADGPLSRWFSSVGAYLVKNLQCSVLIAQTEIGDEEFAQLLSSGVTVEP